MSGKLSRKDGHWTMLTIGELAKRAGLRASALRYYEEQGLLKPAARTEAGYRLYDKAAEQTLRFIQRAQRLGFSLSDIQTLLAGWQEGDLSNETVIAIAEERYLALERQATHLLVLQHELELFLQDLHRQTTRSRPASAEALFERLLDRVCANPLNQPPETMLTWLMQVSHCILSGQEGQALLNKLRGQHVHIWQEDEAYHILVVSQDPEVGRALEALARLEARCQANPYPEHAPEFAPEQEGYRLIARGEHAFLFARLFLALERE